MMKQYASSPIYVIYASTSGNVEIVCERIADLFNKEGFNAILLRSEKTSIEIIADNERFVFGTSTWEHGVLNPFFDKLYEEMKTRKFTNKQAAFVGLGDKRYEPVMFCAGIEQLGRLWVLNGGKKVGKTLLIAGEPYAQLDTTVESWAESIAGSWI